MDSLPRPWAARRPTKRTISAEAFRASFGENSADLARLANGLVAAPVEEWTQQQLVLLYRSASEIETILDDHGARRNAVFFRPREVVAIVRWLAAGLSSLVHVYGRLPSYEVADRAWADEVFASRVRAAAVSLGGILQRALEGLKEEWERAQLTWPQEVLELGAVEPLTGLVQLPADRLPAADEEDPEDAPHGARFANRFLTLARAWSSEAGRPISGLQALRAFMQNYCSEEIARRFEARVHNLQSSYDTHLARTPEELAQPALPILRGTASQVLHLLEMVTALTHLYERHDIYERAGESRGIFEALVPEEQLLGILVNDGVVLAYACMDRARPLAEELLAVLTVRSEARLELPEGLVMHARPLSLIVGIVQKHGTPVELELAGRTCSAASMMQMLVLAGTHPEERAYVFRGDAAPLRDLETLFAHQLGEQGCASFPDSLAYLRP